MRSSVARAGQLGSTPGVWWGRGATAQQTTELTGVCMCGVEAMLAERETACADADADAAAAREAAAESAAREAAARDEFAAFREKADGLTAM